jgi:hypothetical protein
MTTLFLVIGALFSKGLLFQYLASGSANFLWGWLVSILGRLAVAMMLIHEDRPTVPQILGVLSLLSFVLTLIGMATGWPSVGKDVTMYVLVADMVAWAVWGMVRMVQHI